MKKWILATCLTAVVAAPLCFAGAQVVKWVWGDFQVKALNAPAGASLKLNGAPLNPGTTIKPATLIKDTTRLDVTIPAAVDLKKGANFDAVLSYPDGANAHIVVFVHQ